VARLVISGEQIYVLDSGRAYGQGTLLHRLRKADGTLLGILPAPAGSRPWATWEELGRLAQQLLVGPWRGTTEARCIFLYGADGQLLDIRQPVLRRFRSVSLDNSRLSGPSYPLRELDQS